jgi:hypothetical protein
VRKLVIIISLVCVCAVCDEYTKSALFLANLCEDAPGFALNGETSVLYIYNPETFLLNKDRLLYNYEYQMNKRHVISVSRGPLERRMLDKGFRNPVTLSYEEYSTLARELDLNGWVSVCFINESPVAYENYAFFGQVVHSEDNLIRNANYQSWNRNSYQTTALDKTGPTLILSLKHASDNLRAYGTKKVVLAPAVYDDGKLASASCNLKILSFVSKSHFDVYGYGNINGETTMPPDPAELRQKYDVDAVIYPTIKQTNTGDTPTKTNLELNVKIVKTDTGREVYNENVTSSSTFYQPEEYYKRYTSSVNTRNLIATGLLLSSVPMYLIGIPGRTTVPAWSTSQLRWIPGHKTTEYPLVWVGMSMDIAAFALYYSTNN